MSQRFFVNQPIVGQQIVLAGAEATHLTRVMRAQVGEQVTLFDGRGSEFESRIEAISRSEVRLQVLERCEVNREINGRLVVGVALPKGDRQKWLVEKLVELGATRLVPLRCERSVAKVDEKVRQRLLRAVIEASKQCRRNLLMEIAPASDVEEFLSSAYTHALRWFPHPDGGSMPTPLPDSTDRFLAVGPEGGWSAAEVLSARQAGWEVISLGPRTLRVETAALAATALLTQYG